MDTQPKRSRILRFVDTLPGNTVATLDKETNVLCIDRCKYDGLAKYQKGVVINARDDIEFMQPEPSHTEVHF